MKKIFIKYIAIIVLLGFVKSLYAQDPLFSSYYENPLYYNPAAPGLISGNKFVLNYREQWPGIPASNRIFNYSSMHNFCGFLSLGVLANSNVEGESRLITNNIGLAIAVPVNITKRILISTGITTSYGQKRIDWSKVEFDDQFDKLYGKIYNTQFPFPDDDRKNYGDLSIGFALKGIFYKSRKYILSGILGVGFNHAVVFPNPNFIGTEINAVPFKQTYHMDIWLMRRKRNADGFALASIYERQGQIETFNVTFRYLIKSLYLLTGFRNKNYSLSFKTYDSFMLGFGYIFKDRQTRKTVKFGYSYDFTLSQLMGGSYGSHELYIVYTLPKCNNLSTKRRSKRYFKNECKEMEFNPGGLFLRR